MFQALKERSAQAAQVAAIALLLIQLALGAALFARHAWAAVTFPFPLDYGEGPILDQALRLARLENIYRADLSEPPFVVANYPPLFPLAQAPFAAAFGPALWYGRAISVLGILAAALFITLTLGALTDDWLAGALGGLMLPCFAFVLHWSAFSRVDSLALALACAGLYAVARRPQTRAGLLVAALALTAAIFTRQSYALAAPLAAFVWLLREPPRRPAFELAAMTAGLSLALLLALQLLTGGGFFFHIVTANVNPFVWFNVLTRVDEIRDHLLLLVAGAALFLALGAWRRPASWWLVAPFLAGAAASALTIGKTGSNVNYLFELCAALSLTAGALLAWAGPRPWLRAALALALAAQVYTMVEWSREDYAPRVLDRVERREELARLLQLVRESDGPVLADEFMGLVPLAGKPLYLAPFEMKQLADAGVWDERPLLRALDEHAFAALLIYDPPDWDSFGERWTGRQQLYIGTEYEAGERIADTYVYRPRR